MYTSSVYVAAVGRATLADGKLTLRLNTTVADEYLNALSDVFEDDVKVSNKNVKIGLANVYAYKSSSTIGRFYYGTGVEEEDGGGLLVYANGDVSITYTRTDTETEDDGDKIYFNVHLKKGWNIMYQKVVVDDAKDEEYDEITTVTPSGAAKWYYNGY
jgi:hypothetical protein